MIEEYCGCIKTEDGMTIALCEYHGFDGLINVGRKEEYKTRIVKCKDPILIKKLKESQKGEKKNE